MKKNILVILSLVLIGLAFIGLAFSVVGIYDNRNHYIPNDEECETIAPLDSFSAVKQITSQWHWIYKVRNDAISARSEQYCPTVKHDVNIFKNGKFLGRTDGKILTTVSKTFIRDCHGKKIYVIRTGDAFETIVNMNKIFVSFELREYSSDPNVENEVIAYAEQFNFFTNEILLKDKYHKSVSKMYMNKYQFQSWTWEYTVYNNTHPAGNPLILMLISAKSSFSETTTDSDGNTKDTTDMCNEYFVAVSIISIIFVSVVGFVILLYLGIFVKKQYKNYQYI